MNKGMPWLWLFLLGTVWGLNELVSGEAFYRTDPALGSVWLAAFAFLVLGMARGVTNRPGTSTLVALVAALYKAVNTEPFFCHLLGIVLLGAAFDAAAWLFLRRSTRIELRAALTGITGAYAGHALFACLMTFVARYEYWTLPGLEKFSDHIFITGSQAALACALLAPLGLRLGGRLKTLNPEWSAIAATAGSLALWIVGFLSF